MHFPKDEDFERFVDGDFSAVSEAFLDEFFGPESWGKTVEQRAFTSNLAWVRSQDQLALYQEGATGMRLTTLDVVLLFGLRIMREVYENGGAVLVCSHDEPAASIRRVRERRNISQTQLAIRAGLTLQQVRDAENENKLNDIWVLDKICKILDLDTRKLGFVPYE